MTTGRCPNFNFLGFSHLLRRVWHEIAAWTYRGKAKRFYFFAGLKLVNVRLLLNGCDGILNSFGVELNTRVTVPYSICASITPPWGIVPDRIFASISAILSCPGINCNSKESISSIIPTGSDMKDWMVGRLDSMCVGWNLGFILNVAETSISVAPFSENCKLEATKSNFPGTDRRPYRLRLKSSFADPA